MDWSHNTDALFRKKQSRLFFLRRLRSFSVFNRLLKIFYQSVVASALFFAVVCWGGGIRAGEASRLSKLLRKASSVVGMELDSLESVAERRMDRIKAILDNPSHLLHDEPWQMGSSFSHWIISPRCKTEPYLLIYSSIKIPYYIRYSIICYSAVLYNILYHTLCYTIHNVILLYINYSIYYVVLLFYTIHYVTLYYIYHYTSPYTMSHIP